MDIYFQKLNFDFLIPVGQGKGTVYIINQQTE